MSGFPGLEQLVEAHAHQASVSVKDFAHDSALFEHEDTLFVDLVLRVDKGLAESCAGVSGAFVHDSFDDSVFLFLVSFVLGSGVFLALSGPFVEVDEFVPPLDREVEPFIGQAFEKLRFLGFLVAEAHAFDHEFAHFQSGVSLEDVG